MCWINTLKPRTTRRGNDFLFVSLNTCRLKELKEKPWTVEDSNIKVDSGIKKRKASDDTTMDA